jgi:hypothetical protein
MRPLDHFVSVRERAIKEQHQRHRLFDNVAGAETDLRTTGNHVAQLFIDGAGEVAKLLARKR